MAVFGGFTKHRDYAHGSYLQHEMANGGFYNINRPRVVVYNPIDDNLFSPSRIYWEVQLFTHSGDMYIYLVPAESDNSEPLETTVEETVTQYIQNPVEGGRRMLDYIDREEEFEQQERLQALSRQRDERMRRARLDNAVEGV